MSAASASASARPSVTAADQTAARRSSTARPSPGRSGRAEAAAIACDIVCAGRGSGRSIAAPAARAVAASGAQMPKRVCATGSPAAISAARSRAMSGALPRRAASVACGSRSAAPWGRGAMSRATAAAMARAASRPVAPPAASAA